jgi:hypothetical protein
MSCVHALRDRLLPAFLQAQAVALPETVLKLGEKRKNALKAGATNSTYPMAETRAFATRARLSLANRE